MGEFMVVLREDDGSYRDLVPLDARCVTIEITVSGTSLVVRHVSGCDCRMRLRFGSFGGACRCRQRGAQSDTPADREDGCDE